MLKRLFPFILFSILHHSCYSQVAYGPEVGLGIAGMHFEPSPLYTSASTGSVMSYKIGGNIEVPMNNKFYFQVGLSISRKGDTRSFSYYENDSFNEAIDQTLTIGYIDLPVNVFYKTKTPGFGRFFFGLGATPSYIIGGRNKLHASGFASGGRYNSYVNTSIRNGNPISGFDIGVNITVGYELPSGFYFKTYYTSGVNDIGLGLEVDKNRVWGIGAGYFFIKGRDIKKENDEMIDKGTGE